MSTQHETRRVQATSGRSGVRNRVDHSRRKDRRAARLRPTLEDLEARVTPTVVFHPYFGAEATTFGSGPKLNNTPVELIFWGSTYWNNPSGASAATVASSIKTLLAGPSYQHLSQYGAGASPYLANWWIDNDHGNPPNPFTIAELQNEVVNAINDPTSPILAPSSFSTTPLYMVVTPFGTPVSIPGVVGYHGAFNANTNFGNFNLVYGMDTQPNLLFGLGGTLSDLDGLTSVFSHESSEAMTNITPGSGIGTYAGPSLPGGGYGEIGDFEPEDYNLDDYRVGGVLVQAQWDFNAQAFTVSDGNAEHLDLFASYTHNANGSYTYTGSTLAVSGDQLGAGSNDAITVDTTSGGGVQVTLNGQTFAFEAGVLIHQINIDPGTGTNSIQVNSVPSNCGLHITGAGTNNVTIGSSSDGVQGINSTIAVDNGYPNPSTTGSTTLTIDDSGDTGGGRSATLADVDLGNGIHRGSLLGLAPGSIYWLDNSAGTSTGGVAHLSILGGAGGNVNTFTVVNDGKLYDGTSLTTGYGSNTVNINGNAGGLTINSGSSAWDTVNVNATTGGLTINDEGGQDTVNVNATTGGVTFNDFFADSATVNVNSTSASGLLTINTFGVTADYINIAPSTESLSNIQGNVTVNDSYGVDSLSVNDQNNPAGDTYTMTSTFVTRTGSASVSAYGGSSVVVNGGSGNDTYNVSGTNGGETIVTGLGSNTVNIGGALGLSVDANGNDTINVNSISAGSVNVQLGNGTDTVNVAPSTQSLNSIQAVVAVNGGSGASTLNVDDQKDPGNHTYTMDSYGVTRDGSATINYSGVSHITVNGCVGTENYNISGTEFNFPTTLNLGTAIFSDSVNVQGTSGPLTIQGRAYGFVATLGSGNLDDLAGAVTVNVTVGPQADAVYVNDGAAPTNETYTVTSSAVSRAGFGGLTYANLANLIVTGGPLVNVFNVISTAARTSTQLQAQGPASSSTFNLGTGNLGALPGPVVVNGTAVAGTKAVLNDQSAPAGESYTIGYHTVARAGFGGLTDNWIPVTVNTGLGNNSIGIVSPTPLAPVTISASGSYNVLDGPNVASTWSITGTNAGSVGNVFFTDVTYLVGGSANDTFMFTSGGSMGAIYGGGGTNTLDYTAHGTGVRVNLAAGIATGVGGFSNIQNVNGSPANDSITGNASANVIDGEGGVDTLTGGGGGDTFVLAPTQASGTTITDSGSGNTIDGANVTTTWTLTGAGAGTITPGIGFAGISNLVGGSGADTFKVRAPGSIGSINGGLGMNALDYSGFSPGPITVNLGTTTATAVGGLTHINDLVGSGSAGDTLIGANATNIWNVIGTNAGTIGTLIFSAIPNLTGGTGMDIFAFQPAGSVTGTINGGGGGDWLDYARYTSPVTVNLAVGMATGAGRIANIQNVRGGKAANTLTGDAQGNILIGGGTSATITGGTGRSILIGDVGADTITGGSAGDILIGGATAYDSSTTANDIALEDILAEWQSGNTYATRIANIKGGTGLTGGHRLRWGIEVTDDNAANVLTAAPSATVGDWFFKGAADTIKNYEAGEQIN